VSITFYKYQGTGNDFIIIDNHDLALKRNDQERYAHWCHRRFGIGADGLILLQEKEGFDFEMVYFNSDGRESSMCGNGGRCILRFAHDLGVIGSHARFLAIDGEHEGQVNPKSIALKMGDVSELETIQADHYLDTGSPHYVKYLRSGIEELDLQKEAQAIRYNDRFKAEGTNVNFVQDAGDFLKVRTYERGVEDETYSCGTGVTAVALVNHICSPSGNSYSQALSTPGGLLRVRFDKTGEQSFENIWLEGPAEFVFKGQLDGN